MQARIYVVGRPIKRCINQGEVTLGGSSRSNNDTIEEFKVSNEERLSSIQPKKALGMVPLTSKTIKYFKTLKEAMDYAKDLSKTEKVTYKNSGGTKIFYMTSPTVFEVIFKFNLKNAFTELLSIEKFYELNHIYTPGRYRPITGKEKEEYSVTNFKCNAEDVLKKIVPCNSSMGEFFNTMQGWGIFAGFNNRHRAPVIANGSWVELEEGEKLSDDMTGGLPFETMQHIKGYLFNKS